MLRNQTGTLAEASKHSRENPANPVPVQKPMMIKPKTKVKSTSIIYGRDSVNLTQKFYATRARSDRAKCIRCYNEIGKDEVKLAFDSYHKRYNHPLSLSYHIACFIKYPPKGFSTIEWDVSKRDEECEAIVNCMFE